MQVILHPGQIRFLYLKTLIDCTRNYVSFCRTLFASSVLCHFCTFLFLRLIRSHFFLLLGQLTVLRTCSF